MKCLFLLVFSAASLFAKSASTGEVVSPAALASFKHAFVHAQEVYWSEGTGFYKAEFIFAGQYLYAYFSKEEGRLLAVTKNISFTDLPVLLQAEVKEHYGGYWITEIVQMSGPDGINYYLTLENADRKLLLQSEKNSWSVQQKKLK